VYDKDSGRALELYDMGFVIKMMQNLHFYLCFIFEQVDPNVSISANVCVGTVVRLIGCIILDDVEIKV
jgi:hypothetical protein